MIWSEIIEAIEKHLDNSGKSRRDLPKTLGVDSRFIADIKSGKSKRPNADFVLALISRLNISPQWLETGEGNITNLLPPAENQSGSLTAGSLTVKERENVSETGIGGRSFKLPLLKQKVSCGAGIEWNSEDNVEEHITFSSFIKHLDTKNAVCYKVAGSSMHGAGIHDGDYVITVFNSDREAGDGIYVIALDNEVYCKRLEYDKATKKVYIYSERFADLDKAELVTTIGEDDTDRLFIFGKVRLIIRPSKDID
jgi:phage repressor protein C with HTH and peptisase S24 domain